MTRKQALDEAKKRWGERAYIEYRRTTISGVGHYRVGFSFSAFGGVLFHVCGHGDSWAAALLDAGRKSGTGLARRKANQ